MRFPPPPVRPASRFRSATGAVVVLVVAALGAAVFVTATTSGGGSTVVQRAAPASPVASSAPPALFVHVLGAVHRPGLYQLTAGARAVDAVAAAGGFTDTAEQAAVNLARFLGDGEQLHVPERGESAPVTGLPSPPGRVNINTAGEDALDTLPRVGPALAGRIIAWRDANGPFTAVEDLLNVSGIGTATLDALRELVTI